MRTWDDYKDYVKSLDTESRNEIEECEKLSGILTSAIHGLNNYGLTNFFADKTRLYNKHERIHMS